jgi:hypothetical protein
MKSCSSSEARARGTLTPSRRGAQVVLRVSLQPGAGYRQPGYRKRRAAMSKVKLAPPSACRVRSDPLGGRHPQGPAPGGGLDQLLAEGGVAGVLEGHHHNDALVGVAGRGAGVDRDEAAAGPALPGVQQPSRRGRQRALDVVDDAGRRRRRQAKHRGVADVGRPARPMPRPAGNGTRR